MILEKINDANCEQIYAIFSDETVLAPIVNINLTCLKMAIL